MSETPEMLDTRGRSETPETPETRERGNILILGLSLWLVACLLLFGTISVTLLALERRELVAQSDSIALDIADDLDDAAYYGGAQNTESGVGTETSFAPTSAHVRRQARELLGPRTRLSEPTGMEGGTVVVTLEKEVDLAFVPSGTEISRITIDVTSRAQVRSRPIR